MGLLMIFVGAVVLWMVVSFVIVLAAYNRKPPSADAGQSEAAKEFQTFLPESGIDRDLFSRHPEITDWLILDADGRVVKGSSKSVTESDNQFIQLIQWTREKSIDLKLADVQIMELETEKRTIIISFPNASEIEYYLVLYRVPVERSALHEELSQLNWNDLRQLMEREDTHEETH